LLLETGKERIAPSFAPARWWRSWRLRFRLISEPSCCVQQGRSSCPSSTGPSCSWPSSPPPCCLLRQRWRSPPWTGTPCRRNVSLMGGTSTSIKKGVLVVGRRADRLTHLSLVLLIRYQPCRRISRPSIASRAAKHPLYLRRFVSRKEQREKKERRERYCLVT